MAIVNTGMQRATELTVTKTIGGTSANGYPRVYKIYDAFGNYPVVAKDALGTMAVADYTARLAAFKIYVESVEIGVTVDTASAYVQNLGSCPIG